MNEKDFPAWDLSDLYNGINDPRIKTDLATIQKRNQNFAAKYKGRLNQLSAEEFLEMIKFYEATEKLAMELGIFAQLNMSTQLKNQEAVGFFQSISETLTEYNKPMVFLSLEINQLSEEKIAELLKNQGVAAYKPWLERLRRFKKYELSEEIEEVLMEKSLTSFDAWVRLYEEHSARLKYTIDGKEYSDSELDVFHQSANPEDREKAGREVGRVMRENTPLFTFIYNMIIKDKAIVNTRRGYKTPISQRNLAENVEDETVKALGEAVRAQYANLAERFYKLKAKWLGMEKLQNWDRNAPLPFCHDRDYSWQEAVDTVLKAYNEFSPRLYEQAQDFFSKNWIDVPPRDGKRGGAFAMPLTPEKHPYLFLNFTSKKGDILTLAHELGHGCHMRLSSKQGLLNDDMPLTLAEVASTFGEMLTFQSLLRQTKDDKEKLCLLADKVNDMINTSLRQIAYYFFESRAHEERKNGELSSERLAQIWEEEMKAYLGESVVIDDVVRYNWAVVGHFFFMPFYVYAYSFADCLTNSLYQVYQEGTVPDFENKYLEMLSNTSVKKYDELLKPFNLDARHPEFWNKGLQLISHYIDELEALDKKLGL